MDTTQIVGIVAGIFTGVSLLPQLIKVFKEKKAENISIVMLLILMIGLAGWIWYGALKDDLPIMITNSFSFLINALLMFLRFKYKDNK
ncbi:MAG: SemiSWEET transporter [Gemmatimonadaceae bacterium]|nr:SemiSWEET transporter [Chitinophagaceae bacterium]